MIRVGMQGNKFALVMTGIEFSDLAPGRGLPLLTVEQAADLHRQLGDLLPDEFLNVEPFSSDDAEEAVMELEPAHSKKTESREPYIVWNEYYQAYKNWCIANGEQPSSANKFTREMTKIIPDFEKKYVVKKVDGKSVRVVMGVAARFPGGESA